MIQQALEKIVHRTSLTEQEAMGVMDTITSGDATPAQIGALLAGLRMKGETIEEVTGFARVMREKATRIESNSYPLVDTCGTGGDGSNTFNISTVSSFVAAGADVFVAKHGNRAASSQTGAADVLEALGVKIDISPERVAWCIDHVGIGFLFAAQLHQALRFAVGPRREVGFRTVFNTIAPMTNPAGAKSQVMGVYMASLVEPVAHVLNNLGAEHAYVVHSDDGLDEISITAPTQVAEIKDGQVKTYKIDPGTFGFSGASLQDLKGGNPEENAAIVMAILQGEAGPRRDIVILNAAAAIVVGGRAETLEEGTVKARQSIDSGAAMGKLEALKQATAK